MRPPFHIDPRGQNKYLVRWHDPVTREQHSHVVKGDRAAAWTYGLQQLNPTQVKPEIPKRTFRSYCDDEFAAYRRKYWKQGSTSVTQGNYLKKHILPHFGDMNLADVMPTDISRFYDRLEASGLAPATRCNVHAILSCMFRYACDDLELIEKNPVKKRLAPRKVKNEKPALSDEQVVQLLEAVPMKYKAYFATLTFTGVRPGEGLGLKWSDVDFAGRQLHIRRAIYRQREIPPKTKASLRDRPMAQPLYEALINHRTLAHFKQGGDYVFASSTGTPINPDVLREVLKTALVKIGVNWQPRVHGLHLLRHSSASLAYKHTGGDVKAVATWLAHSSSRITMDVYTHVSASQEQRTAEQLAAGIFAQPDVPTTMH